MTDIMGAIASMVGLGQQREEPRIGADLGPAPVRPRSGPRLLTHGLENMPIAPFVVSEEEARRAETNPHANWRRNLPMGVGAVEGGTDRRHEPQVARLIEKQREEIRELGFQTRHRPIFPDGATMPTHPMGPGGVSTPPVVERASRATNISPDLMKALIGHESGGRADARPIRGGELLSSAVGHGQFTEGTWLRLMRQHGSEYGLPADLPRDDVLRLRTSPEWSALMVGVYANENIDLLEGRLGRSVTPGEAYLGHFLGGDTALAMLRAKEQGRGDAPADRFLPANMRAQILHSNREVFYENGRMRSVDSLIRYQTRNFRHLERASARRSPTR